MPKRRGNGEGSISKRKKDGLWQCQVTVGVDPRGKPIRKTFYGKTRDDVRDKLNETLMKVRTNTFIEPSKLTFGEWIDIWLNNYMKNNLRKTTWDSYEVQVRIHIKPTLGGIKLTKLETMNLQQLYNDKLATMSPRSVRYIHQVINGALVQAMSERKINFNPADAVKLPRNPKKEMRTLDIDSITRFLTIAKEETERARGIKGREAYFYYPAYLMELATGIRRGELLALRWSDVDLKNSVIRINQQLVRVKGNYVFSEPKTQLSKRVISIPEIVVKELEHYRLIQARERLKLNDVYEKNDLVFCTEIGRPIDPKNFIRNFKGVLKKAGLESIRFHDMRHTFAKLSLNQGVDIKSLQETLGHHSPAFTLEVYGHTSQELQNISAMKVGDVLKKCVVNGKSSFEKVP